MSSLEAVYEFKLDSN